MDRIREHLAWAATQRRRSLSVRAHCKDCVGSYAEVKQCVCEDCALWPWRLRQKPTEEMWNQHENALLRTDSVWD